MTLAEFLLARIAEDEAVAQVEKAARDKRRQEMLDAAAHGVSGMFTVNPFSEPGAPGDPARVLAECEARRRIVEELHDHEDGFRWSTVESNRAKTILEYLTLSYADHPDYRQEWKP